MLNCKRFSRHSIIPRNLLVSFLLIILVSGFGYGEDLNLGQNGGIQQPPEPAGEQEPATEPVSDPGYEEGL